jgi:putative iron-dependent peroxidase
MPVRDNRTAGKRTEGSLATGQAGIFAEGSKFHHLLEFDFMPSASVAQLRAALAAAWSELAAAKCEFVIAFGPTAWASLGGDKPAGLHDFREIGRGARVAPSTQADLMIWLHGVDRGDLFDAARAAARALAGVGDLKLDLPGFVYHDSRDMTGFVDGSANPTGDERMDVALDAAGGSFVLGQRWIHNLAAFEKLPQAEQEKVIGRTKPDSIELSGDDLPEDSHVGRTDIKVDGVGQKMYRRSFPYGSVREHGLYFLAFACDVSRYDAVLRSMFGLTDDGRHDRLTDFSRPVSGSYFYAPSPAALEALLD